MTESNNFILSNNRYSANSPNNNISPIETMKIKNNRIINIGVCTKFYFYILGSALFKFFHLMILGSQENMIALFGFSPIIFSYNSIQNINTYLSYIIFGTIFHFYFKGKNKDKDKLIINNLSLKHDLLINQDNKNFYIQIILTCLGFATYSEFQNLLFSNGYHPLDYWTFEIIFTFFFMRKYFEFGIYKHHKCSIFSAFFICTILLFIASFLPDTNIGNQYQFVKK